MQLIDVINAGVHEPKKALAWALLALSTFLLLQECWAFYKKARLPIRPPAIAVPLQKKQAELGPNSPVFKVSLFGPYLPKLSDMEIRQSTLDVEVVGILYSADSKKSQIIVKLSQGDELPFRVGDTLPGGAIIRQINKDGILVFYNGALESLTLPQNELLFDKPPMPLIRE